LSTNGYEVARRIRGFTGPSIPLVALTGHRLPEDRARVVGAGFDAHLVKPLDPSALVTALLAPGGSATGVAAGLPAQSPCAVCGEAIFRDETEGTSVDGGVAHARCLGFARSLGARA
jgi:DNA-binding response OmpR family regulator